MTEITHRKLIGEYDRTHRTVVSIEAHTFEGKEVWTIYDGNTFAGNAKSKKEAEKKAAILIASQQADHEKGFVIEHYRRAV